MRIRENTDVIDIGKIEVEMWIKIKRNSPGMPPFQYF